MEVDCLENSDLEGRSSEEELDASLQLLKLYFEVPKAAQELPNFRPKQVKRNSKQNRIVMGCGASTQPPESQHGASTTQPPESQQHDLAAADEVEVERQFASQMTPATTSAASTIQAAERGKQARLRVKRKKTSLAICHTAVEPDYIGNSGGGGVDALLLYRSLQKGAVDGSISLQIFQETLQAQGMQPNEEFTEALFKKFDADQNGTVDLKELSSALAVFAKGTFREKCRTCFEVFDTDGSSALDESELRLMLRAQVKAGLRAARTAAEFGDKPESLKTKDGTVVRISEGSVEMSLDGIAKSSVDIKPQDLTDLWEATDDQLYERLQADKIVAGLVTDIFNSADRDKDAKITCDEFIKFVQNRPGLTDWWGFFEA